MLIAITPRTLNVLEICDGRPTVNCSLKKPYSIEIALILMCNRPLVVVEAVVVTAEVIVLLAVVSVGKVVAIVVNVVLAILVVLSVVLVMVKPHPPLAYPIPK